MTKLESKLPEFHNGIEEIILTLLEKPKELQVAIVLFKTSKITTDTETSDREPTIKIKRIEPVFGDDRKLVENIYFRVYGERTGEDALPFDKEMDAKINGTDQLSLSEVALPPIIATHTAKHLNFEGKEMKLKIAFKGVESGENAWIDIASNFVYPEFSLRDIKPIVKRALKTVLEAEFSGAINE